MAARSKFVPIYVPARVHLSDERNEGGIFPVLHIKFNITTSQREFQIVTGLITVTISARDIFYRSTFMSPSEVISH